MRRTITIIRTEHRRLAAIINCFIGVLDDLAQARIEPDFDLLESVHEYCRSFLYKFHHPKEDGYLFPALCKASPEIREKVEQLEGEHEKGVGLLDELDQALADFRQNPKENLPSYVKVAKAYRDFEWQHMGLEEKEILPLADKVIGDEVWEELDRVFQDHDDPVFGDKPQGKYENLLSKIVNTAPAPHGLG